MKILYFFIGMIGLSVALFRVCTRRFGLDLIDAAFAALLAFTSFALWMG